MITNYITWNIDPEIFEIWGRGIRWYGVLLATGFYIGYLILSKNLTREGFSEKKINQLSMFMIVGTILGLRLGHCFFYEPEYYLSRPMEIFKVWKGGLASHGGALGILIAIAIYAYKNKQSYLGLLDRIVVIIPLAGAFVRIGNLMNSEIVGKFTNVSWGFIFPRYDCPPPHDCDISNLTARHPTQLYEALFYFILFAVMIIMYKRSKGNIKEGFLLGVFITLLFSFRFIIEFFKDVQVNFEQDMVINMGQILSIPFVLAGIAIIIYSLTKGRTISFNKK
ncbi:MAG: prolipoprotein diacylglyceryl transferase [Marinilabiliales bacterium]|nr:MAG: prolipoprotein diacylglyceryl transferase [Marinilabiliales bacterium]